MKKDFLDKYSHLASLTKSVLQYMYKTLTGDMYSSFSSCSAEREVDNHVIEELLGLDDPQIMLDMMEILNQPDLMSFGMST